MFKQTGGQIVLTLAENGIVIASNFKCDSQVPPEKQTGPHRGFPTGPFVATSIEEAVKRIESLLENAKA